MNPFDLLKNFDVEDFKKKSAETISKMRDMKVTGESGSGFVKVTINGEFYITDIDFEENSFIKEDLPAFRDLIISAQNDAVTKMKDELQKNLFK
ncbi:MAG TPA: YbaB/EbfC family nucleoid-associated protein [Spirochaetota bacterium]|nr:YbaB/EbfC family nucleoid-associated protein [Spirochaetota bacterium]